MLFRSQRDSFNPHPGMRGGVAGFPACGVPLWVPQYTWAPSFCASSRDVAVSAGVGAQCSRVTVPPGCPAGVARGLVWAHALRTVAGAGPSPPRGAVDG